MSWEIRVTPTAIAALDAIRDRRVRQIIRNRIDGLAEEADKQGSPLVGELAGYRSVRAAGQRYRVIFRAEPQTSVVVVVAVGIRKEGSTADVYALARRLFRLRLLDP